VLHFFFPLPETLFQFTVWPTASRPVLKPLLEMVLKLHLRLKSKAQTDEKAQSARVRWRMSSTF